MPLKDDISLLHIPSVQKANKSYSVIPSNGNGDLICSRNGTATYFDKDGILRTAQANEPRLDFDPVTKVFRGVLVEPSATNLLLRSEEFNLWSAINGASVIANTSIAPNGLQFADTINLGNNNDSGVINSTGVIIPLNTTVTFSVFLKNIALTSGQTFRIRINNGQVPPNDFIIRALVDLFNKTVVFSQSGTNGTGIIGTGFASIQVLPNDWVRVSVTGTRGSGGTTTGGGQLIQDAGINNPRSFFAWGAQLEIGSAHTSYIPTVASQVTRPADIITVPNYSTLFGSRNQRHIELGTSKLGFLNEDTLQLPEGHNKLVLEKLGSISAAETTQLGTTTLKYGVRSNIKSERDQILALNPSLVMIPGKGSAGGLQTILPNDGTADFTVSRNGTATFLGSNGLLQIAGVNEPRLEFNTDGSFRGVLVEPAATNLVTNNNTAEGLGLNTGLTLQSIQTGILGPNINNYLFNCIQSDISPSNIAFRTHSSIITTNLNSYSYSFFILNPSSRFVGFTMLNLNAPLIVLDTITLTFNTSFSRPSLSLFAQRLPNNVFLISVSDITDTIVSISTEFRITLVSTGVASTPLSVLGTFGFAGLTFVQSTTTTRPAIPSTIFTSGNLVTRPADVISRFNVANLIGQTEGTLYIDLNINSITGAERFFTIYSNTGVNNGWIGIFGASGNRFRFYGDGFDITSSSVFSIRNRFKVAISYKNGETTSAYVNGILISTLTANTTNKNYGVIEAGGAPIGSKNSNNIRTCVVIPVSLNNTQLQALTTL